MKPQAVIVDYGLGNLMSVRRAFEQCGAEARLSRDPAVITDSPRLVLPGVGAYGHGMAELGRFGLTECLRNYAASGKPLLGICLGMQMFLELSREFGLTEGLGLFPGNVEPIPAGGIGGRNHKIPHIGWCDIRPRTDGAWDGTLLEGIAPGTSFYFVHSFMAVPADPADVLAGCDYDGIPICAAIRKGAVTGCQFHPEKSGPAGLRIIGNFCRAVGETVQSRETESSDVRSE